MTTGFVTNLGLSNLIWSWADENSFGYDRKIQFGTGSGQGVTDLVLAAPVQDGVLATRAQETTNVDGDTARYTATVTADDVRVITEVGVFEFGAGRMEIYGEFDAITLANGDSIVFQIDVIVTNT